MHSYPLAHHVGGACGQVSVNSLACPDINGRGVLAVNRVHVRRVVLRSQEVHPDNYPVEPCKRRYLSSFRF